MDEPSRRRVLGTAATALAAALAGCSTSDESTTPAATTTGDRTSATTAAAPTTTDASTTTGESTTARETTETSTTSDQTTTKRTTTSTPTTETVTVAPGGRLRFDPARVTVPVGSTVEFRWDSGGHNVRVAARPDGGDWDGTSGGDGTTYGVGHTHSHTFAVAGTYEYYCAPHRGAGMRGTVVVE
ncbi:plastocyanin/azurin family copper-binding protein [Halorubellus sp. PRR65]|uniref:plastocyanin/azurin family copper-binding protein n=1 Tax=Halorubellus sp. PRR65 TaxID=3098148 RepID=UPI002B25B40C|nr:plastocyanin/azurin family copper-binding protein [Halorubellus sp. PRR65]